MTVPPDGAVGLGDIVPFVKEKGGMGADSAVLEAEPIVVVVEKDSVPVELARLVIEPDAPLDGPDDDTVGPRLPVEFESGNGGVETPDWEADEMAEPALGIVYDVEVNGVDVLEEPTELKGEPLVAVEVMTDDPTVPLGTFVEFDKGNGADVPGT